MNKKAEEAAPDPMAEKRAEVDPKEGTYSEPKVGDEPKVMRHQVDARKDIVEEDQDPRGTPPRRADPHAFQRARQGSIAEKANKDAEKEDSKKEDKK